MAKRMMQYGLLLLLAAGLTAGLWTVHADAANEDLGQLLPFSEQIIASDRKVLIKHAGAYRSFTDQASFLLTGKDICEQLGLYEGAGTPPEITEAQDHLLYKATTVDANGIEITVWWIGFFNGASELRISAKADGLQDASGILKAQKQLSRGLEAIGIKPHWNIMIQGSPAPSFTGEESWLDAPHAKQLRAQEVGRYEDAGSLSVSYYSPQIRESASIGGKQKMNLQVAVHRNSNTQEQRITIGSPAISIEY